MAAAPLTLQALARRKVELNNMPKMIRKLLIAMPIIYLVGIPLYAVLWMSPHAKRALSVFKRSIAEGTKIERIRAIATEVGADRYSTRQLQPAENGATEEAVIYFYRFPTGLAKDYCIIKFKDGAAISIRYGFSG